MDEQRRLLKNIHHQVLVIRIFNFQNWTNIVVHRQEQQAENRKSLDVIVPVHILVQVSVEILETKEELKKKKELNFRPFHIEAFEQVPEEVRVNQALTSVIRK